MKISYPFLFCLLIVLVSCDLHSQEFEWTRFDKDDIISKDSIVRDGYTLLFYNKSPQLEKEVKKRMINAFFDECRAQEADTAAVKISGRASSSSIQLTMPSHSVGVTCCDSALIIFRNQRQRLKRIHGF